MPMQDELFTQKIEVLLDMQEKHIKAEIQKLRDELSQVKEELRKEIHSIKQDPSFTSAGGANVSMYADAPQHQAQPEQVPRYAQQPPQQYAQGYGQAPQQGYAQQQYPPQQGYPQQPQGYNPYPQMPAGRVDREAPPVTKPIDRNGVAPSEVSVEKFFYMGGKK